MDRFRGSVALVTGASAGIGEGIARELCVVHGMKVVGCARRQDRLTELENSYAGIILWWRYVISIILLICILHRACQGIRIWW